MGVINWGVVGVCYWPSSMVASSNNLFSAKCVIVGDGAVGKVKCEPKYSNFYNLQTCLLYSYAKGEFPKSYVPTVEMGNATTLLISVDI